MKQIRKGEKLGLWISVVLVLGLAIFAATWVATSSKRADRALQEYAHAWNLRCPKAMGMEMLLDRVVALPGRVVVYQLSSITFSKEMFEEVYPDMERFREEAHRKALEELLGQPDLKTIRKMGVTFKYFYKDKEGVPLFEFEITPQDYK